MGLMGMSENVKSEVGLKMGMEDTWCGRNGFGGQWVCEDEKGGE